MAELFATTLDAYLVLDQVPEDAEDRDTADGRPATRPCAHARLSRMLGGDPKMIAFISTYLFGDATHLNDLYNRKEDSTTQYWTLPHVPGRRLIGKPVFVGR